MKIEGLDELNKKLKELGNVTSGQVLYNSLMFASTPMWREARSNAPYLTGTILNSIRRRRLTKGQSANLDGAAISIYVQLKGPRESRENAYYYIFHEEYGARGRPPAPFIRPAFNRNKDQAVERFASKINERIDKAIS